MLTLRFRVFAVITACALVGGIAGRARAALTVVTPGEQNTQSGENGCAATPCQGGHWLHYPEILGKMLGAGYTVKNNGDGGAVLGCDAASAAIAGTGSFCKSPQYSASIAPPPDIVIIGPFGEHDQRIVAANATNTTNLYKQSVFEAAYEGLVQKYLAFTKNIYIMTPIDVPWGGTPNLPAGDDLVKNVMLPAARAVAQNHGLTVIDTYTVISGTAQLVRQYYDKDGQVNANGQLAMASLILGTLMGRVNGSDGGASDAGGNADGAADATTGSGGTTGGAPGSGGATGTDGGAGGATTGTGGATGAAGASGTGGASGSGGASGTGGSAMPQSSSGGGCSLATTETGAAGGLLLTLAALIGVGRRRRRR